MLRASFFLLVFSASLAFAQNCTTYVMAEPFDALTKSSIDHLKAENFMAKMGSTSLPIVSATQTYNNRVLVLLQVGTNSNADKKQLQMQTQEVVELVRQAPAGRPLAFGIFAEKAFISNEFSADPHTRSAMVDEILAQAAQLPGKNMAIYDSLLHALAAFGPHQPGDTILLLTEGYDSSSKHKPADLTNEFVTHGTRLLVVRGAEPRYARGDLDAAILSDYTQLSILSSLTGGAYTNYSSKSFLEVSWAGYILGIQIPAAWEKPKEWQLQLKDSNGRIDKKARLYFPWKLLPCGSLSARTQ